MATVQKFGGGSIIGGSWSTTADLNTETGQTSFQVIISTLGVVFPEGSSYTTVTDGLRALINQPGQTEQNRKLLARALQSVNQMNAELQTTNRDNQQPNRVAEPLPVLTTATTTPATPPASNQESDDRLQTGAPSTSGLATGSTSTDGQLNRPSSVAASVPISTTVASAAAISAANGERISGGRPSSGPLLNPNTPQARINPLSVLSSYTYSLVLYMVTPEKMNAFIGNGGSLTNIKGRDSGVYVLAQSAGINNNADDRLITLSGNLGGGQAGLDYYIDELTLSTLLPGGESRATASTELKFKIYEPYSFNLLTDIAKASARLNATSPIAKSKSVEFNGFQQHYILGIKFYGYDAAGNVVTSSNPQFRGYNNGDPGDQNAIIQRFFAIKFANIKFKLDGKTTVYNCEAVIVSEQQAYNQTNGAVKAQMSLSGGTVAEALVGGTNSRGLAQVLTEMNRGTSDRHQIDIPSTVKIEFLDENNQPVEPSQSPIGRSRLLDDGAFAAATAPLSNTRSTEKVTVADSFKAVTIDTTKRTIGVNSGQPITTIIDNIIVKSNWVTNALKKTTTDDPESKTINNPATSYLQWYTINPIINVAGVDSKTKNWVYDVTYQIKPYNIPYVRTNLANTSKYPGPFKLYNYLLTGQNTEIVSYEQQYDNLYYVIASASTNPSETDENPGRAPRQIQNTPGSSDPNSGKNNSGSRLNDEVRAQLYSPGDVAQAKIKILGDPDYIMTSVGVRLTSASQFYGNDNSISPLSGQVFIQIVFNTASDYQPNGLMDVSDKIQFYQSDRTLKAGIDGIVYMVTHVESVFSRGQFTQTLECVMVDETQLVTPESAAEGDQRSEQQQTGNTTSATPAQSNGGTPAAAPPTTTSPAPPADVRTTNLPTNTRADQPSTSRGRGRNVLPPPSPAPEFVPANTQGSAGVANDDSVISEPPPTPTTVGA